MKQTTRILISACLVFLLIFCVAGFVATIEPMNRSVELVFKFVYAIGMMVAIFSLVAANRRVAGAKKNKADD